MKNQKGITLVALVVTIIVLLILAAVSLSLVAGSDGLLSKASNSVDRTIIGSAKERVELKVAELVADYYEAKYVNHNDSLTTPQAYVEANIGSQVDDYTLSPVDENHQTTVTGNGLPASTATNKLVATFGESGKVTWNQ